MLSRFSSVVALGAACVVLASCGGAGAGDATGPSAPSVPVIDEGLSVRVSPRVDTLLVGKSVQLAVSVTGKTSGNPTIWSSSDSTTVKVSTSGYVTGLKVGTARVRASVGKTIDSATVLVMSSTVSAVKLTPTPVSVEVGSTVQLSGVAVDANGVAVPGVSTTYATGDFGLASVSSTGLLTGKSAGTTTVTASAGGKSASATLTVTLTPVATVKVSPASASVVLGQTLQLTPTTLSASGATLSGRLITYASSAPAVATVSSSGLVSAVAVGNATITVTSEGKSTTAAITVTTASQAPVASVKVTLNASSLLIGQTTQAVATAADSTGKTVTGATVSFQSSNPALATVNSTGVVTAVAAGSVTISAIVSGKTGSAPLTVTAPKTTTVNVSPASVTLKAGQTAQFSATPLDASGKPINGRPVSWKSGDFGVASISSAGLLTAKTAGTVKVTATVDSVPGTADLVVMPPPPTKVAVALAAASITAGTTTQATATLTDSTGKVTSGAVTWSSSNTAIATVSASGVVTGVAAGSAVITGTSGSITGSANLTVTAASTAPVSTVTVSLNSSSITTGQTTQATAVAKDAAGNVLSGRTITWSSSATSVATISSSGLVTGVAAGSATITADVQGVTGTKALTVAAGSTPTAPNGPISGLAAVVPQQPMVYLNTTYVPSPGRTLVVNAGGSLQAAIDSAKRGDQILVQAGATFTGAYILRNKAGTAANGWITIRTSTPDANLPAPGTRVGPSHASLFPKIQTPGANAATFKTEAMANGYRLIGLEITAAPGVAILNALVHFGDGSGAQNSMSLVPSNLILDRSYVHGNSTLNLQRCVALNGAATAILDSYLSECHAQGSDSQALIGWNGPGPFKIVNNYLEGAGENIFFGGADPAVPNLIPSDIEIRQNRVSKPLAWKGVWTAKNLLELKNARRVLVEGNIFENSWADGQVGFAVLFKSVNQAGNCPWCGTSDVTFRYNVIRNSAAGVNIASHPETYPTIPATRILITHNLLDGVGHANGTDNGRMFMLLGGLNDVAVVHNTGIHNTFSGSGQFLYMDIGGDQPGQNMVIRDNVGTWGGPWGAVMGNTTQGAPALGAFSARYAFERNVVIGMPSNLLGTYPTNNGYPNNLGLVSFVNSAAADYRLSSGSPYSRSASDGTDPGADFATLNSLISRIP